MNFAPGFPDSAMRLAHISGCDLAHLLLSPAISMPSIYDWGIPGITLRPPPLRDGYGLSTVPTPFSRLKFSPIGLFDLRRHLGVLPAEPTIFKQFQTRFRTADFGWFAGGASTDGQHIPVLNSFFPEFDNLRQTLPIGPVGNEARKALQEEVQHAVFDLVRRFPSFNYLSFTFLTLGNTVGPHIRWFDDYHAR
jgi:hypothetical protein